MRWWTLVHISGTQERKKAPERASSCSPHHAQLFRKIFSSFSISLQVISRTGPITQFVLLIYPRCAVCVHMCCLARFVFLRVACPVPIERERDEMLPMNSRATETASLYPRGFPHFSFPVSFFFCFSFFFVVSYALRSQCGARLSLTATHRASTEPRGRRERSCCSREKRGRVILEKNETGSVRRRGPWDLERQLRAHRRSHPRTTATCILSCNLSALVQPLARALRSEQTVPRTEREIWLAGQQSISRPCGL